MLLRFDPRIAQISPIETAFQAAFGLSSASSADEDWQEFFWTPINGGCMTYTFLWLALIVATLDWAAVEKKWQPLEYLAKPGVMLALLAWLWQSSALGGPLLWFGLGIVFSLAGDVFLMLPYDLFIAGLVSFLLAHLAYVVGFNSTPPTWSIGHLILALLLAIVFWQLYRRLAAGLGAKGRSKLKIPVFIYASVITLMVFSAGANFTRPGWETLPALLTSLGAALFFASDSMLAWDRFVAPLSHARLKVMTTYHLGQIGIVLGVLLR
jgi:uncharacterized membrane protein YhhN